MWFGNIHSLQWRYNGCDGVSNLQPHDCLLNRLFRCRSKKTSKLHVTGLCAGNSLVTGEFLAQMASNTENISIWWRHHVYPFSLRLLHCYRGNHTTNPLPQKQPWRTLVKSPANPQKNDDTSKPNTTQQNRVLISWDIMIHMYLSNMWPGPWFNIKMSSYRYRKSHCGDKTVVRSSYLHNGISYTGKMTSFYWIRAQDDDVICQNIVCLWILTFTCTILFIPGFSLLWKVILIMLTAR